MPKAAFAPINFAPARVEVEQLTDGATLLYSPQPLQPYADNLGLVLQHWARETPDSIYLAERDSRGEWRKLSYGEVEKQVRSIAQSLLDRGLNADTPIAILSGNSVDNALLQLAAMQVGVPVCPISPAYSLLSHDHAKLKYIISLLEPGMIYAADGATFSRALLALDYVGAELILSQGSIQGMEASLFSDLTQNPPTEAVDQAHAKVGPDTLAKILFTSGSTGDPKGVMNSQRMLCSNQQAIRQVWPFLEQQPLVILDWLPWSHTFGSNHNFNMVLTHGGTLYIDGGKPAPGLIEQTVANLLEISPTLYFNVPQGFAILLPYLEADDKLRDRFFKNLKLIFYAGAALPQNLWERLEVLAEASRGVRIPLVSAWGATETAPMITAVHFPLEQAGVIGLPAPGCQVKMVPSGSKLELRVKGPNITPGYWKHPQLTKESLDADGFYCMGDAGRLADPSDPAQGIVFDGRVAENFKLMSGTWVHVGELRVAAITAGAPVIQDAVVTGHNAEEVGLLIFPSLAGCRSLCPELPEDAPMAELIKQPQVRDCLVKGLGQYNERYPASSMHIGRIMLMAAPPSIDANEITDKGYTNQSAVLDNRAQLVSQLYAAGPNDAVVIIL